jgi:hypothetical protein
MRTAQLVLPILIALAPKFAGGETMHGTARRQTGADLSPMRLWEDDGEWAPVSALLHRDFDTWCRVDARQFVEVVASALNVSVSLVRVLSVCTHDGNTCRSQEASCPPESAMTLENEPRGAHGDGDADSHDGGERIRDQPMSVEEDGEWQGAVPESSRIQVVFAVPSRYFEALTNFLTEATRLVSRLEVILVEMRPTDTNASTCPTLVDADANPFGNLWPEPSPFRNLHVGQSAICPTGFRCSMRREMHLEVPLCKAEVGRFSAARRAAIVGPLYVLITLISTATLLWLSGRRLFSLWLKLSKTLWPGVPASKSPARPHPPYGIVSWEEYCESYYEAEYKSGAAAAEAEGTANEADRYDLPARSSFDAGAEMDDVDVLLRQLDDVLQRGAANYALATARTEQDVSTRSGDNTRSGDTGKALPMSRTSPSLFQRAAGMFGPCAGFGRTLALTCCPWRRPSP